jgi:hypothetical protein
LIERYAQRLSEFVKQKQDITFIVQLITQLKQEVAILLFKVITVGNQISNQFLAFRQLYLAGQGDFVDVFIEEAQVKRQKLDSVLVPVSGNDVHQVFKRALIEVGLDKRIDERILNKFSFDIKNESTKFFESSIFGVAVKQHYKLDWPMSIIISHQDIQKYNILCSFLYDIKKTSKRLGQLKHKINKELPKSFWALFGLQVFFLNSLWSYIQMDLIDSEYQQVIVMAKEGNDVSLEELIAKHATVLKRIMNGCFLDQVPSSVHILASIETIIQVINETCKQVDLYLDSRIELREQVLKQLFLVS